VNRRTELSRVCGAPREERREAIRCKALFGAANLLAAPFVELERGAGAEHPKINQTISLTCAHVGHIVRVDRGASNAETNQQNEHQNRRDHRSEKRSRQTRLPLAARLWRLHPLAGRKIERERQRGERNRAVATDERGSPGTGGRRYRLPARAHRRSWLNDLPALPKGNRDAAESRCCVSLGRHDAGTTVARNEARAQEGLGWGWWEKASDEEVAQAPNKQIYQSGRLPDQRKIP